MGCGVRGERWYVLGVIDGRVCGNGTDRDRCPKVRKQASIGLWH